MNENALRNNREEVLVIEDVAKYTKTYNNIEINKTGQKSDNNI